MEMETDMQQQSDSSLMTKNKDKMTENKNTSNQPLKHRDQNIKFTGLLSEEIFNATYKIRRRKHQRSSF